MDGPSPSKATTLHDPIDIVFLGAYKDGYVDYLNNLMPLVPPGELILAHNTNMVPEYMKATLRMRTWIPSFIRPGAEWQ